MSSWVGSQASDGNARTNFAVQVCSPTATAAPKAAGCRTNSAPVDGPATTRSAGVRSPYSISADLLFCDEPTESTFLAFAGAPMVDGLGPEFPAATKMR